MDQHEYRVTTYAVSDLAVAQSNAPYPMEEALNEDARIGWRVVSVFAYNTEMVVVQERPSTPSS
jgi:Domain of unknown function (DUF4177)